MAAGGQLNHIAIIINSMEGGGAERAVLNLAHGFLDSGCRVDLVVGRNAGPYLAQLRPEVRVFDLKTDAAVNTGGVLRFRRYLKSERPPVVLSALKQSSAIALCAKILGGGAKIIPTLHGMIWAPNGDKRILYCLGRAALYRWADRIVAVSAGVADDFTQFSYIPRDRIDVIYNPIVGPDLLSDAAAPVDHPWFQENELPVVISVGRLITEKDHETLIRAFSLVRQRVPARLVILGEGVYRRETEALITSLGLNDSVQLPGFVGNPYAYMAKSAVFVLSSVTEGFGNVIVEALAVGTPVVSTDCFSGPSEILDGGRFGKLVPVGAVEPMAAAIEEQIRNPPPKQMLMERARDFDVAKIVSEYRELFARLGS